MSQLSALTNAMTTMSKCIAQLAVNAPKQAHMVASCETCGEVGHSCFECQLGSLSGQNAEQVNAIGGNFNSNYNPYSKTYNPEWRNHPNLQWRQPNEQQQ